ncbi:chromatin-remodeling ATPase INO80 isoform X1 [Hydra vulgaris]|uniref:chromatin-remodeling ATPase INO80 isoform X1 n=1 Tax=Hydra vulgaris TaxID=6087 RepID=UPI001F5F7582|nr:chromatin-remodeling ATPase INO80 [Hydra vulgaris]
MDHKKNDFNNMTIIHPAIISNESFEDAYLPVNLKFLERTLNIDALINYAEKLFKEKLSEFESTSSSDEESDIINATWKKKLGKLSFTKEEWHNEKKKFYNIKSLGKEREWLREVLLNESSDEDDSNDTISEFELKQMLKLHVKANKVKKKMSPDIHNKYSFYGSSLVIEHDQYIDRFKKNVKTIKKSKLANKKLFNKNRKKVSDIKLLKQKVHHDKEIAYKRKKLWNLIAKKEIPKISKTRSNNHSTILQTLKKVAQACQRELRKEALRSQKISKDAIPRARRMAKEMLLYWRRFDRVEKEHRKKAEKEAMEQRRQDEEMREMKRQQRKLNFLITQTELYAHFMGRKMKGNNQDLSAQNEILKKLEDTSVNNYSYNASSVLINNEIDDYDADSMKEQALLNAQTAVLKQQKKTNSFADAEMKPGMILSSFDGAYSLSEPALDEGKLPQPKIFEGKLKSYQLKGMNWLVSLYEKGINGILADEMGLGKTVQSISFLAYLAEVHNIWGPFLVVAPASTLHNWQQEFEKFLPRFKVLPYWGDPGDRKSLRKFWNHSSYMINSKENAPFHVLITSYQLIVQDVKYFQRIRWQYLVLDEAQAIKSSSSMRWKILLGYNCRNRLLLTGTPIQNTMAELWALLHFIMPTLFDSHDEFNEWFSKDIEGHASEKKPVLDQNQLSRLHMILKPFMLRRIKKDVENELSEKIEIKLMCTLSSRQKQLYQAVKNKIIIEDLLLTANASGESKSNSLLMNLVMQFRKVCNHPELFERKEPLRGLFFTTPPIIMSKFIYRHGLLSNCCTELRNKFSIWNEDYIHTSLDENGTGCYSFTRFIDLSPKECVHLFMSLVSRLSFILTAIHQRQKLSHERTWRNSKNKKSPCSSSSTSKRLTRKDLLICPQSNLYNEDFCFTGYAKCFSTHQDFLITEYKSTRISPQLGHVNEDIKRRILITRLLKHYPVDYPNFLTAYYPKVCSPPVEVYCSDRSASYQYINSFYGTEDLLNILHFGLNSASSIENSSFFYSHPLQGLDAARPLNGWSHIKRPDRSTLASDSGKLLVLDKLLTRLKKEDHRVLIYSQMTKMIDILEEFMKFRKHSYMRLDGSSKISDRRDMVSDFQSRDIFAFLLSTRAGGLGINLTAADTVIFYDSDWNPTVDQQAMDRAHRLGQTKQVTVYRLVTKGTVEEKILNRAREKSEIQNIVISGGQFNKEVLKPKEVASLLLDDIELAAKLKQRQFEKKVSEENGKRFGRKRKQVELDFKDVSENSCQFDVDENSISSIELGIDDESADSSRPSSAVPFENSVNLLPPSSKRGRGRGIPRSGRWKPKTGSLAKAAASAAAMAGVAAGSAAAYAAYGYTIQTITKE